MVGDHIYLNIGGIFSLKPFNLTGIAGGFLFISHSFDEQLLKQYNKNRYGGNEVYSMRHIGFVFFDIVRNAKKS